MVKIKLNIGKLNPSKFQCSLLLENGMIFIGSDDGKVFQNKLLEVDEIPNTSKNDTYTSILKNAKHEILSLDGVIRSIQELNDEEIIILSSFGGIIIYNLNDKTNQLVNEEVPYDSSFKRWRLLVINEDQFITIGNWGSIELWYKENSQFLNIISYNPYKHASFCIEWLNRETKEIIINNYVGESIIYEVRINELIEQQRIDLERNIQKLITFEEYLIAVNYYGEVSIYNKKEDFKEVTNFQIDPSRGNWIQESKETGKILIGTNKKLLLLDKKFEDVEELDIGIKQILSYGSNDIFLTDNDVVKLNYSKAKPPSEIRDYKFKKVSLVGNSQTGKTSFCSYLDNQEGDAPLSTYGTHLWSIPYEESQFSWFQEDKRILYLDLAGQEEEHFTYFPKILDSDVILLFYQGIRQDTFEQAIKYYKELKPKCKKAKFYFIQTFSDQLQRVRDSTIRQEFDKLNIDYETQLIKVDNSSGTGFDEYHDKVLNKLEWESTPITYRLPLFDTIESIIHDFYVKGTENEIELSTLSDVINLDKNRTENIIELYYSKGFIDYLVEEKTIIINHKKYAQIQSLVANVIVQKDGKASREVIYKEIAETQQDVIFIDNILKYYRQNKIGAIFKEGDPNKEVFIFPRKLKDSINIDKGIEKSLTERSIDFRHKKIKIDVAEVISFLNQFPLTLRNISKTELLLERNDSNDDSIFVYIALNKRTESDDIFYSSIRIPIEIQIDKGIQDALTNFFWNHLGQNICDFSLKESEKTCIPSNEGVPEILKKILNHPCERPYLDFKLLLDLSTSTKQAEFIKDVIALTNMGYNCGNNSYLIVGVEEKHCKIKSFKDVEKFRVLEQQISQIINQNIEFCTLSEIIPLKINDIFQWQQKDEISEKIPFKENHKETTSEDRIMIIKLNRVPNSVCDLSRDFTFKNENGRPDKFNKGTSWMRTSSHTYKIGEYKRKILRKY